MIKKELDNGIKLYIIKKKEKNIKLAIGVKIGSIYEDIPGISHFLEHMMFKSNKKYSAKEIDEGLELSGAISNAFTSTFLTCYISEVIPKGFKKVVDIFSSMFENEKFDEKEFLNEKKVVLSEMERIENDPEEKLDLLIPQSIYGNSDYGRSIVGNRESIESIEKNDLEEFKAKYYVSKNMFIVVEGNLNRDQIKFLEKKFSSIAEGKVKHKKPSKGKGKDIEERMNTRNQIYFALSNRIKIKKFFEAEALSYLLSGGISSKTFQIFRNKYGIGYHIDLDISYIYPDEFILSLLIPGFEKEKEKYLDDAIEDFLNVKLEKEYFEGRKRRTEIVLEKKESDIKSILYLSNLIAIFEKDFDFYKKKIIEEICNKKILKNLEKLKNGKRVYILPK
jgi:predicted Zn-dependent peptidase